MRLAAGPGRASRGLRRVLALVFIAPLLSALIELRPQARRRACWCPTSAAPCVRPAGTLRRRRCRWPPALRRVDQPGRDPALGRAHAVHATRLLEWNTVERRKQRERASAPARFLPRDVDRARHLAALAVAISRWPASPPAVPARWRGMPVLCLWLASPVSRLVDQPAAAPAAAAAEPRADALPAPARPGGPGASSRTSSGRRTTGCRPTTSRSIRLRRRRPPHLAHQHGPGAAGQPGGVRFRLHLRRDGCWSARPRAFADDGEAWTATAATSTTGTTRARCAAAPAIRLVGGQRQPGGHLLTLRPGLPELADQPVLSPRRVSRALRDTLRRLAEAADRNAVAVPKTLSSEAQDRFAVDSRPATLAERWPGSTGWRTSPPTCRSDPLRWHRFRRTRVRWHSGHVALQRQCADATDDLMHLDAMARAVFRPLAHSARTTSVRAAGRRSDVAASCRPWTMPPGGRPPKPPPPALLRRTRKTCRCWWHSGGCARSSAWTPSSAASTRRLGSRTGLRLPLRPPRHLLTIGYDVGDHRARPRLLRPAGLRGAPGQLRRHRAGTGAAGALVRARPPADHRWRRSEPAVVERLDVRVPDAAAGHADLRQHPARPDLPGRGVSARSNTAGSAACPGASPSRATTRSTCTTTTSTGRSACPASASSAAWPTTWSSRRTPPRWR